jgi:hypothetical protein
MASVWFLQKSVADTEPVLGMQLTEIIITGLLRSLTVTSLDA